MIRLPHTLEMSALGWIVCAFWLLTQVGCQTSSLTVNDAGHDAGGEPADAYDGSGPDDSADAAADPGAVCNPSELEIEYKGLLETGTAREDNELGVCTKDRWIVVAPAGCSLHILLRPRGYHLLMASVHYPDAPGWKERLKAVSASASSEGVMEFSPPRSGEFFIHVRSIDPEAASRYDLEIECTDGCDLECTRYPVVLVHGWTGWGEIGPIEYFYNVPDTLEQAGYAVHIAVLDPYNSVAVRSGQLAAQLDEFLAAGRARKVNLIAHSQGCLDARRVISSLGYGDRVSALVSVAGPHQGTPIADIGLGLLPGPAEEALAFLLNLLGAAGGNESDAIASFESLTTEHVQKVFNPANPDDPRVTYISWAGLTCPLGIDCGDICDVEIRWAYDLIYLHSGDNDGMVPVSSAPWGDYRGTIPADHFDEIGQVLGITGPNFDHLDFYLGVVRDLAVAGH